MLATLIATAALVATDPAPLTAEPARLELVGSDGRGQAIATGTGPGGVPIDLTREVRWSVDPPGVATVDADGLIRAIGDGTAAVIAEGKNGESARIEVIVRDTDDRRPVYFAGDVVPMLTRAGCNSGGCHGKADGQNGFRLSLLGFDPASDFEALAREGRGRRVFPAAPEASLLLRKATAQTTHGGGKRIEPDGPEYRLLRRWVATGTPFRPDAEPRLIAFDLFPARRPTQQEGSQQLRAVARYDDGTVRDVTRAAQYQVNAPDIAAVGPTGLVTALESVGEAAVMARYNGKVAVARITVPSPRPERDWSAPPSDNPIDAHIFARLRELGVAPSPPCSDAEFARRSSLDLCGVLPDGDEVAAFERDRDPQKRRRWVERLIGRPEHADLFALKWSNILRNRQDNSPSREGSFAFHDWIRHAIASNMPYDRFAAEILAAKGDQRRNPAVSWYRRNDSPLDRTDNTAQLFLGTRIQCARCHHHPFERWGQDDYYGLASFFTRVREKSERNNPRIGLAGAGMARNPTTKREIPPTPLGGEPIAGLGPYDDPRDAFVAWLREPSNPYLAPAVVNRYWKHFFGRGLVEPEDDIRISNPPSHPELLDDLAKDFVSGGYDLRQLILTIATSEAYRRSSLPTPSNAQDRQNYARYYPKRLIAEVFLDATVRVTEAPESFRDGDQVELPGGYRAVQVPDDGFDSRFLDAFGRPKRVSVCECERVAEANLSQTLLMVNSAEVQGKVAAKEGRAARYADDPRPDAEKIAELYRAAYSRAPEPEELQMCIDHLARKREANAAREGWEDLVWALISTKEFQFNH